jgi:hypothetical protein
MRWYQYPLEVFCFSGALFVGVMEAWVATGVMYFVLLALFSLGAMCIVGFSRWVSSEIREAVYERVDRITRPLQYAVGLGDVEDIDEGIV